MFRSLLFVLVLSLTVSIAALATPHSSGGHGKRKSGKSGGGAWDFEGSLPSEKIQLALEATRASTAGNACDAVTLSQFLAVLTEQKAEAWNQIKVAAEEILTDEEVACLVQAYDE